MNKSIYAVFGAIALGMMAGCGSSGGSSDALITVNGENISRDQMMKYMSKKPTVRVSTQSGVVEANVAEPLDFQALQDMIGQKVITQLAKDEGVFPTPTEVGQELEFRKRINPNYVKELTANGITFDAIKENLGLELAREKLLTKGITVTQQEADDYVRKNPAQFTDPATANMLWVFVKTKSMQAVIDREIQSGQSFQSIAVRYSEFAGAKENGGQFPQTRIQEMRPELQKIVNTTAVGKVSSWLQLSDGFARFYVQAKAPAKAMVLDKDKRELVRRSIARGRGEQATDLAKRVLDKIKASDIKVSDSTLADAWKKAFDKLKKEGQATPSQPNTATSTSTSTSTTGK